MKAVKRIEIVIDAAHAPDVLAALRGAGAPGYTVFRDVNGMGDRGVRGGDSLGNVFRNCYVLVACDPHIADQIADAVGPLLKRHGGIYLVSDAEWLQH